MKTISHSVVFHVQRLKRERMIATSRPANEHSMTTILRFRNPYKASKKIAENEIIRESDRDVETSF